jgi:hypothetical protein
MRRVPPSLAKSPSALMKTKPGAKKTSGQPDLMRQNRNPLEPLLTPEPALLRVRP